MSINPEEPPVPFAPSSEDPPMQGRGETPEAAINDALERAGAEHGAVFRIDLYAAVSNPHVGEYIVRLRNPS
jgi:hypothetical protein